MTGERVVGDPGFGIGTIEGGLIVQGVDGPLFYDVEQHTKTPMTGCKKIGRASCRERVSSPV